MKDNIKKVHIELDLISKNLSFFLESDSNEEIESYKKIKIPFDMKLSLLQKLGREHAEQFVGATILALVDKLSKGGIGLDENKKNFINDLKYLEKYFTEFAMRGVELKKNKKNFNRDLEYLDEFLTEISKQKDGGMEEVVANLKLAQSIQTGDNDLFNSAEEWFKKSYGNGNEETKEILDDWQIVKENFEKYIK